MSRHFAIAWMLFTPFLASSAVAQEAGDVVVMRRTIAPPSEDLNARWVAGDRSWVQGAATCGDAVAWTSVVECRANGRAVDPSRCKGQMPPSSGTSERTEGCSYEPVLAGYGEWSPSCSAASSRTKTVACRRSDGRQVDASLCGSQAGTFQEAGADLASCVYDWRTGAYRWTSTCSSSARNVRSVECVRKTPVADDPQGVHANEVVSDSFCPGARPQSETGEVGNVSSCSGTWTTAWVDAGSCDANKFKDQVLTATCSGSACNPDTKPATQTRRISCTTSCQPLEFGREPDYGTTRNLRVVTLPRIAGDYSDPAVREQVRFQCEQSATYQSHEKVVACVYFNSGTIYQVVAWSGAVSMIPAGDGWGKSGSSCTSQ